MMRLSSFRTGLLGAALLLAGHGAARAQGTGTVQLATRVAASTDDAEEDKATGAIDLTSSDLELVLDGTRNQWIGMRFANVAVPQGTVLANAYLQFAVDEAQSGPTSLTIYGQAADNAATFSAAANNISSRARTTATVAWNNIPAWTTIGQAGPDQRTPDLKAVVQEIISRPGWAAGNALALLIDGSGHRTAQSFDLSAANAVRLVLEFTGTGAPVGGFPVPQGAAWRYLDTGTDLGATAWKTQAYNDAPWNFGPGALGFGDPVATTINGGPATAVHPTAYFRHVFDVPNAALFDSLRFQVRRDDGVVVYLNGTELFRQNMPAGPVAYGTLASTTVGGADELAYFEQKTASTALVTGRNVLAVEVHQSTATSSDLSFDLSLTGYRGLTSGPVADAVYPLLRNSVWSYYYAASGEPTGAWKTVPFSVNSWSNGPGQLGYGNGPTTTLNFGPNAAAKPLTAYFRRVVDIQNYAALPDTIQLGLLRDDGAAVYVNGTEVLRVNLPTGPLTATTAATLDVTGGNETAYYYYKLPKTAFVAGRNAIAVEVHQRTAASDDLGFDLELKNLDGSFVAARGGCNGPGDTAFSCFTSVEPNPQTGGLVLPATHTFQLLARQGQAYTTGGGTMPSNNDFTGYVARGGSSTLGYLAINHEVTPGAVSVLDLAFNATTKLWNVTNSQAVSFASPDLVRTANNCSGGITPRGTVITAEETAPAASAANDANNDGYQDLGWLVELDPATRAVKTYATPGKQEKLWAMGRMAHENVAVAADDRTAYYGEDSSIGRVYKFVATTAGNLSSGTLYALAVTGGLNAAGDPVTPNASGTWVLVPNTTQAERNATNILVTTLGTQAFNGVEDVEIGTLDGKIYFCAKGVGRTYRFTDNGTTVSNFETFAGGRDYAINYGPATTTEAWGSGNDNLVFDNRGNNYVQQDGSRNHVWMTRPGHSQATPQMELFARTPTASEPTGMTFTPDFRFAFLSFQHPDATNAATTQVDAAGQSISFTSSATIVVARREFLGTSVVTAATGAATVPGRGLAVYPNPSTGQRFTVGFSTARPGTVEVALFDLTGKRLGTLARGRHERGEFTYDFDTAQLGHALHGLYVLRLSIDGRVETRKIVID